MVQVLSWTILKEDEPNYYLESLESLELETDRETSTDRETKRQTEKDRNRQKRRAREKQTETE